jgi:signal transduction histidine kinase/CheY-like chemotaxis protein
MARKRKQGKNPLLEAAFSDLVSVIDLIPANVYWKDLSFRYKGCNELTATKAGFKSKDEIIGIDDFELAKKLGWNEDIAKSFRRDDELVISTKKPRLNIEEPPVILPDGSVYYQLTKKVPIFSEAGKVIGVLGISVDITNLKKLQKELKSAKETAEEFNTLREKFIQNMEHDLRTPLSGLESAISLLSQEEVNPKRAKLFKFASAETEAFKSIINAILNFDHKRYTEPVLSEPCKLTNTFRSIYVMNYLAANAKGLKLHYRIDENIPSIVLSDEERIKHILLNLVGNAIKFTEKGEVFFEAKLVRRKDPNLLIEFIVKDTGIGIPKDKYKIIFERFVRLDDSNKGRYKGTGLGLANVKDYVDQLAGEFRPIQSKPNKATTFAILIPMKESLDQTMSLPADQEKSKKDEIEFFYDPARKSKKQAPIEAEKPKATQPPKTPKEKPTSVATPTDKISVLLVEDSLVAQHMAKTVIVGLSCAVDIAGSAEEALKMVEEKNYDLIFADIGLPGMDGIEMTRHIRYNERKQGKRPTPIIGQTANANAKNKKAGLEAGMQDLFPKPLSANIVSDMLQNYTRQGAQSAPKAVIPPTIKNKHVIDWDIFNSIWQDKASAKTVFVESKFETFGTIEEFKLAYKDKDWKQVAFLAHKMRGAFVYFGCSRLEEAFSHLEDYLNNTKAPDPKAVKLMYNTVITELHSATNAIENL